jgi:hypothetical protein
MKLKQIVQISAVILLLGVFFFATSIKELHYGFSSKFHTPIHTDHCDNHIHSTEKEGDCYICSIDISTLFDSAEVCYSFSVTFLPRATVTNRDTLIVSTRTTTYHLRGPPAEAV